MEISTRKKCVLSKNPSYFAILLVRYAVGAQKHITETHTSCCWVDWFQKLKMSWQQLYEMLSATFKTYPALSLGKFCFLSISLMILIT